MIDLYAIVNEGESMQLYVREGKNRRQMQALLTHIIKKIQNLPSKIIKSINVHTYSVYYFRQASFIFILATEIKDRMARMQNYLRIVADIFYDSYDEAKFHIVLDRIMEEINRCQFGLGVKGKESWMEEESSLLVQEDVVKGKNRINNMLQQRSRESRRAYVVITFLFFVIMALGLFYLLRKWN